MYSYQLILVLLVFFQLIESRTVVYDGEKSLWIIFCSLLNGRDIELKTITCVRIMMIKPLKGTQFNCKSDWSNGRIGLYYWPNHAFSFNPIFRWCLHLSRLCPHFYCVSSINYYAQIVFIIPKGVKTQN